MSGVHRQALDSLQPGAQNALVIGIIINSFNMKTIDAARTRFNYGERGVWTFMLRDSKEYSINVTVWGSVQYVTKLSSEFHIGSVVEVINPKVMERRPDDRNELFVPSATSSCSLTVNEGNALVQSHDAPTRAMYEPLLRLPIKNPTELRSLKSIFENLETLRDQYVDVLVVVTFVRFERIEESIELPFIDHNKFNCIVHSLFLRMTWKQTMYTLHGQQVGDIRNVMTRDGRNIKFRKFEVTDGSTEDVVSFVLWDNEWIERAAFWEPKRTVLFLADARIAYDNFMKKTALSIARKTVITENPDVPQTTTIRNSIKYYDLDTMSGSSFAPPNPDTITTVMTVQDISNKVNKKPKQGERIQFATILKAYVLDINVDSLSPRIISKRCALCKRIVPDDQDSCMDLECPSGNGTRAPMNTKSFNLKVNLKDDTGYLIGCKLTGDAAERVLGCTTTEFQAMILPQREDLKWKFALEKCDIRLHILGPTTDFPNAVYNILSITRSEEEDDGTDALNECLNANF
ncbi:meiosis-specific with OB domain-containing protein isoform X2 [Hylaeus volcanicus]|uniref:meiosis-specific with OB domain-containing protein isoform X2 n=1 Tax=Hylaeus volcanicus TaxID=313075 RepID=UPI0023B7F09B|nr:meiosis-specific with OB domain-containing protein isoform X2 [Hylaeus volcanicus]